MLPMLLDKLFVRTLNPKR